MDGRAAEGLEGAEFGISVPARDGRERRWLEHSQDKVLRRARSDQSSASVATSFQFGSRERVSREKVQTSLTSDTFSGSPSITSPARSRVAEISSLTTRSVTWASEPLRSAPTISALLMP